MDEARARGLLLAERDEVRNLLKGAQSAISEDQEAQAPDGPRDVEDAAQSLGAEGEDEDIAGTLQDRLAAIERALRRLDAGTYGRSVRSGDPIPDERLEADPAAELTVEEARSNSTSSLSRMPRPRAVGVTSSSFRGPRPKVVGVTQLLPGPRPKVVSVTPISIGR